MKGFARPTRHPTLCPARGRPACRPLAARLIGKEVNHKDAFSACHPAVNLLYFLLVLLFTMFLLHPVTLGVSLVCALAYAVVLNGRAAVRFGLRFLLPLMVLAAVINPAFNHQGVTILGYLPTGNPLTLESILYGLAAACMLAAVVAWFSCCTAVLTTDKLVYLFGRVIPALSLVLSMTLRFVPRFTAQFRAVREAQRGVGRDVTQGGVVQRARHAVTVLSILVTWSLENAIETADSMKSRGYGLPGRTAFSLYRLDGRDKAMLAWLAFCGFYLFAGALAGGLDWQYYPAVRGALSGAFPWSFQALWLALCLTPLILNGREARRWTRLRSST